MSSEAPKTLDVKSAITYIELVEHAYNYYFSNLPAA